MGTPSFFRDGVTEWESSGHRLIIRAKGWTIMLLMATYTAADNGRAFPDRDHHAALHEVLCNAGKSGITIRGMYVSTHANTVYVLFEADNAEQIADCFKPILDSGTLYSVPVVDRLAM